MWETQERKKLNEIFNPVSEPIFGKLKDFDDIPWGNDSAFNNSLDMAYLYNHSGDKYVSSILHNMGHQSSQMLTLFLQSCYSIYKNKWTRLWEINNLEFNPIENYSMEEKHTGTDTDLDTPSNWQTSEVQTPNQWKQETSHKASQDYKSTDTQKPTNWKEEVNHKASQDYKESDTQKPTNWQNTTVHSNTDYTETETKKPTNWKETKDYTYTNYKESDTDTPTNWKKTTTSLNTDNGSESKTSVYAFNSSDAVPTAETETKVKSKTDEEQTGTYKKDHEITGSRKEDTSQSGEFETEKTITGSQTDTTTQSGTFDTEHTQTGYTTDEKTQSGTFATEHTQSGYTTDETTHSGTFTTTNTQNGTYEKKTTYNSTLKRSGNIGVTTSQQMAQSSIELWQWLYFEEVFKDLDKFLCLETY